VTAINTNGFQIIYLDNLDFGASRTRQYILPRIVDFRFDVIRSMIQQDTNPNTGDDVLRFGRLKVCALSRHKMLLVETYHFKFSYYFQLRHPFESIYTRGEIYRSMEVKLQQTEGNGATNDDVGVVSVI
jgi:hypothetical protein